MVFPCNNWINDTYQWPPFFCIISGSCTLEGGKHTNDMNCLAINHNTKYSNSLSQKQLSTESTWLVYKRYEIPADISEKQIFLKTSGVFFFSFLMTPYLGQLVMEWNKPFKDILPSHRTFFILSRTWGHQTWVLQNILGSRKTYMKMLLPSHSLEPFLTFYLCCIVQKHFWRVSTHLWNFDTSSLSWGLVMKTTVLNSRNPF